MTAVVSQVERQFVLDALAKNMRVDGRQPMEHRRLKFTFRRVDRQSSAEIQLGRTRVMCVTSADVVPPYPDRPAEGFVNFSVDLSAIAAEEFQDVRGTALDVELIRVLERCIRDSRAVDTEALCIVPGEMVWSLRCDVHVLDHGGNLLDAACLATVASLHHFRRLDVSIVEGAVKVHDDSDRAPVALSIHHTPLCVTFGVFPEVDQVVVDPTDREEAIMTGHVVFGLNAHKELCVVHKLGGAPMTVTQLLQCARLAGEKVASMSKQLERALAGAEAAAAQHAARKHAAAAGFNLRAPTVDTAGAAGSNAHEDATSKWLLDQSEAKVAPAFVYQEDSDEDVQPMALGSKLPGPRSIAETAGGKDDAESESDDDEDGDDADFTSVTISGRGKATGADAVAEAPAAAFELDSDEDVEMLVPTSEPRAADAPMTLESAVKSPAARKASKAAQQARRAKRKAA